MNLLIDPFSGFNGPREEANVHDPLTNVLVIAIAAAIAGAESYEDIVLHGTSKRPWLTTFLDLTNGIPSHDTFRCVFGLTHEEAFEQCFAARAASRADAFEDEVVAIDVKTAATGWAVLRKMALNLLKSDSEARTSIRDRRREADAIGGVGQ